MYQVLTTAVTFAFLSGVLWQLLPAKWRRMCFAIKAMIQLLLTARLHTWKYSGKYFCICDMLEAQHDSSPERVQLIFADESPPRVVTLCEMEELANRVANWCLSDLQLKPGATVALMMSNCPEFVSIFFGLAKVCVATALINTNLTGKALVHSLEVATKSSKSQKVFIVDDDIYESMLKDTNIRMGVDELGLRVYTWRSLAVILEQSSPSRPCKSIRMSCVKENDALLFIFTSGTTGFPKASKITHSRYYLSTLPLGIFCSLGPEDRIYSPLPMFHSAAGMLGVGAALRTGAAFVSRKKFSVGSFSKDCFDHNVTCVQYIGELCRFLIKGRSNDLDSQLKIKSAFGNGLSKDVWVPFQKRYKVGHIIEFYASTEGNVALFNATGCVGALGFVPRIVDFLYPTRLVKPQEESPDVAFRDVNGRCIVSPIGDVGLLVGPINEKRVDRRFDGYTDSKETQRKIMRNVFEDGDVYFNTGDLMFRDKVGWFYWSDRTGDTFRWKGENCSTSQVASVISEVNGVFECCVYGVLIPGCEGRCGMASISLDASFTIESFDFDLLVKTQKANLQSQAIVRFVRFLKEIPKTQTHKHQKSQLVKDGFQLGNENQVFFLTPNLKYERLTEGRYGELSWIL